jgi:diaminopimelate epimerase
MQEPKMLPFPIPFAKMNGTGNDFVIIDNRRLPVPHGQQAELARRLCRRMFSVGADGVIFIEESNRADFSWQFYNADGSVGEMCGNGSRCAARFAYRHGIAGRKMTFTTLAGTIEAEIGEREDEVRVRMTVPRDFRLGLSLELGGVTRSLDFVDTGVPHAVLLVEDDEVPVAEWGREVRFHPLFGAKGSNANFVKLLPDGRLRVRTYERGVEAETMACGTGAVASALIGALRLGLSSPAHIVTSGGEALTIFFELSAGPAAEQVFLQGPTRLVYTGELTAEALL